MQENKENAFDAFIHKKIKEEGLEQPSANFTRSVLEQIEQGFETRRSINYKPLISKYTWFTMGAIVVGLLCFMIFGNLALETAWLPQLPLQNITQLDMSNLLPNLAPSNTYVYAFIGLAFFVAIQVVLLKKHFKNTRGLL